MSNGNPTPGDCTVRSATVQLAVIAPVNGCVTVFDGSTARPWRTASVSNCVVTVVNCPQSMEASRPVAPIVTPANAVGASATSFSAVEPLTNLVAERALGDADAEGAPTTPEMSVAIATHAA